MAASLRVYLVCAWLLLLPAATRAAARAATTHADPPPQILAYRAMLRRFEKDPNTWQRTARAARGWMMDHDPDYPIYHNVAVEGWINDPNGVTFDPAGAGGAGLYHRFYQYDKTWRQNCSQQHHIDCAPFSADGANRYARTWGQTVSTNLAVGWADWPGIESDSPSDRMAVYSGNCMLHHDTGHPVCIYSGGRDRPCDTGVCASSSDWIHWNKTSCMTHAPSPHSQTNHDSSIFRLANGTYFLLSGGCTFNNTVAPNQPASPNATCRLGNAQIWRSEDLLSWAYVKPLVRSPSAAAAYWELPYLLPFDAEGQALRNDQISDAATTALLFGGGGNDYWTGDLDAHTVEFVPSRQHGDDGRPPPFRFLDRDPPYYSFNPHASDIDPADSTKARRIMFGWVEGAVSAAVASGAVPYWQSAHSVARLLSVYNRSAIAQAPAPELSRLRRTVVHKDKMAGVDALEVIATWNVSAAAPIFGLRLRQVGNFSCDVAFDASKNAVVAGPGIFQAAAVDAAAALPWWPAKVVPQPGPGMVRIHIFLDRSVVEVYTGGAALTARCLLPPPSRDGHASSAVKQEANVVVTGVGAELVDLQAWEMGTMWARTTARK